MLTVFPTNTITSGHTDLGIAIVAAVCMEPQHILLGAIVIDHLRPLHDSVWTQVTTGCFRQQRADISPLYEIFRAVAVDVLERAAVCLVFADEVEGVADLDHACAVRLRVLAVGLDMSESENGRRYSRGVGIRTYRGPCSARHDLQTRTDERHNAGQCGQQEGEALHGKHLSLFRRPIQNIRRLTTSLSR